MGAPSAPAPCLLRAHGSLRCRWRRTPLPAASDPAVSMVTDSPASLSRFRATPQPCTRSRSPRTPSGSPPAAAAASLGDPRGREGASSSSSSPGSAQGCRPPPQLRPGLCLGTTRVRCPGLFRWGHPLPGVPALSPCLPGEPQGSKSHTKGSAPLPAPPRGSLCDLGFPYRSPIWGSCFGVPAVG